MRPMSAPSTLPSKHQPQQPSMEVRWPGSGSNSHLPPPPLLPRVSIPRDWERVEASQMVPQLLTPSREGCPLACCGEGETGRAREESLPTHLAPLPWPSPRSYASSSGHRHAPRLVTPQELEQATSHWAPQGIIGVGGFGLVYRGTLEGQQVAIKRLDPAAQQGVREYLREVQVLGSVKHPSLVRLLGHCPELCALVYQYCPNGNLQSWIGSPLARSQLMWRHRIQILHGLASALTALHSGTKGHSHIVHCDVKPDNVLLDEGFKPRLADVGLAREAGLCDSTVWGTCGYLDPELVATHQVSTETDVYAFGVVALQLVTGEPNVSEVHRAVEYLGDLVRARGEGMQGACARLASCADALAGDWPPGVAHNLCHVALTCLQVRSLRPSLEHNIIPMLRVMAMLKLDKPLHLDSEGLRCSLQTSGRQRRNELAPVA